ncbi:MAG TPA: CBS domain-containing protein [Acidimicrobiales bacterium]|jgi:CBS domain-containing protein|nr:CBS domain-containing protein [Acidimicrobiales bacterium]
MLDTYTREHVGRFSLTPPITIDRRASLRDAARSLFQNDVALLLVTDDDQPAGVVTERDLVAALANGIDPDETIVGYAMTGNIVAAQPWDTVLDAATQMIDLHTRHLLVRDGGRYIGVLSVRDLFLPVLLQALGMHPSDED